MKAPHMHPFVQLIKEDIPMVFRIFARDIRNLWRRPVALIIVLGVAFIPSLYAWINIYANWDPYGNTGNLRVAVASRDAGYQVEGVSVNMGSVSLKVCTAMKTLTGSLPTKQRPATAWNPANIMQR